MIAPIDNERLLKALIALDGRPEFVAFVEWIKQSQQATDASLRDLGPDVPMRQEQGAAQTFAAILSAISRARPLLAQMQIEAQRKSRQS